MPDHRRNSTKKPSRTGVEQFVIQIIKSEKEVKKFTVYKEDSSEDSAKKLVKNLKFDEDLVPYFAKYIDERRIIIDEENHYTNYSRQSYFPSNLESEIPLN